jgi:Family of unknown function (DUF6283)
MTAKITAPRVPCGSCPYRRDVPSGIWEQHEYDKLPSYDGPTWGQPLALFMCHQRDGNLCAGWLACHNPQELLAMRVARNIEPSVYSYKTTVPVFASGAAAHEHGMQKIHKPEAKAKKMISGLVRKRQMTEVNK